MTRVELESIFNHNLRNIFFELLEENGMYKVYIPAFDAFNAVIKEKIKAFCAMYNVMIITEKETQFEQQKETPIVQETQEETQEIEQVVKEESNQQEEQELTTESESVAVSNDTKDDNTQKDKRKQKKKKE